MVMVGRNSLAAIAVGARACDPELCVGLRIGGFQQRVSGGACVGPCWCCIGVVGCDAKLIHLRKPRAPASFVLTARIGAHRLHGRARIIPVNRRRSPTEYKELKGWKPAMPRDDVDRGDWWAVYQGSRARTNSCRKSRFPIRPSPPRAAAYEEARAIIREAQSSLFSDGHRRIRRYPHADRRDGRHRRRQRRRSQPQNPIHDAILARRSAAPGISTSGANSAGQIESRYRGRAGQRRRSRQRQAFRAGPARHRLFRSSRGGFAASICSTSTVVRYKETLRVTRE